MKSLINLIVFTSLITIVLIYSSCNKYNTEIESTPNSSQEILGLQMNPTIIGFFNNGLIGLDTNIIFPRLIEGHFNGEGSIVLVSDEISSDTSAILSIFEWSDTNTTIEFATFFKIDGTDITYLDPDQISYLIKDEVILPENEARGPGIKFVLKCKGNPCPACGVERVGSFWGLFSGSSYLRCYCRERTELANAQCDQEIGFEAGF